MRPAVLCSKCHQCREEMASCGVKRTHPPLGIELWVLQDGDHDLGSVAGRRAVHGPDGRLELALHLGPVLWVRCDHCTAKHSCTSGLFVEYLSLALCVSRVSVTHRVEAVSAF